MENIVEDNYALENRYDVLFLCKCMISGSKDHCFRFFYIDFHVECLGMPVPQISMQHLTKMMV